MLLNTIQSSLAKVQQTVNAEIPKLLTDVEQLQADNAILKEEASIAIKRTKPDLANLLENFDKAKRTSDAANLVLKDAVDRMDKFNTRIGYLERIDLEKKLSELSRKLIAEIVRENLMPVQTNYNMELKAIKRIVEQQRDMLDKYNNQLKNARDEIADFKLSTVFELQNYKKEAEAYMRELIRMQRLDRIRLQVNNKTNSNPQFAHTTDFSQ